VVVDHSQDLALVRRILAGSAEAWDEFLSAYAGLMWAVIRRYVPSRDREDLNAVFAELLTGLCEHKFATYAGRAALSTWLTLVARAEAVDHLRRRFGRRAPPRGLRRLSPAEQEIFRMYYVEGRGLREVLLELRGTDSSWTHQRLLSSLQAIEREVDDRSLRRLAYDLHAQSSGAASGRLLAYLDHVRDEFRLLEGAHRPEYHIMEREARRVLDRVRELIEQLPPEDRRIYSLRFERGWTAQQIAEELGLADPRGAYTLVDRIVRGLRRKLKLSFPEQE
jgi:DNA-directed RNA polymerase specialized sigma24 family protein